MPKRRVAADSDDESRDATPSSKRARTSDSDEDKFDPQRDHRRASTSKARRKNDDDDESGSDEEEGEGQEDVEFEQENQAAILAALNAKRGISGGIAEHGIIEYIELHQFMCHKFLSFQFGSQINFIIGHNGSGKSAVLSGLIVGLGGKINSTGRGNGLKHFIREGQPASEVSVHIKNQGEDAYKPQEYGKTIIVTRRFTREGGSNWKIKSKEGRVISTKKEELAAICDHMNIQVDNPLNVLTQDAARQFLSASHPSDKYKFFLRGTQLSQLSEEYETCMDNTNTTTKVLQQKKEALPDLKLAYREASARFEEASKAREQKKRVDELKKELAWAHVGEKEQEFTGKLEEVAKLEGRLPKIEESLNKAKESCQIASDKVTQYEAEHAALGNMEHLTSQRKELKDNMTVNRAKISEFTRDIRQIETSINQFNTQIKMLQKQIDEEAHRMAADTQAKREETQRQIENARLAVENAKSNLSTIADQLRTTKEGADAIRAEGEGVQAEIDGLQRELTHCNNTLKKIAQSEQDRYAPYGNKIQGLLQRIQSTRWHGDVPLGPLGIHVKVRDAAAWGDVLRKQLVGYLTSFAVTDPRDQKVLKKMLEDTNNNHCTIFIFEKDLFDYSRGEPPPEFLTVLRALEIDNPYVLRILIDRTKMERTLLAKRRPDAEDMLRRLIGGGVAWSADGHLLRRFPEGGESTSPMGGGRLHESANLLLTGGDAAAEKSRYLHDRDELNKAIQALELRGKELKQRFVIERRKIDQLETQERHAHTAISKAKAQHHSLQQEANNDMPANISALQGAKEEAETEKQSLLNQYRDVMAQKVAVDDANKALLSQSDAIKEQISQFSDAQNAVGTKIEDAAQERMKAQNSIKHYEAKLAEEKAKVESVKAVASELEEEFKTWTEKATEYCERYPNPRKVVDVQRNLDSVQKALKEREKRDGISVEEITIQVNKAKAQLESVEKELRQMTSLNKALRQSLIVRLSRWQEFRRHIALRCKLVFQFHLSHRGYFGKVLFDHSKQHLYLKVQTDDQVGTQAGSRDKDPRSLSGGEKSFSTICLLLSLWESIGCPLRCLDEFDVFMDAVNRRISMKMMIETATQSDKKQYILITPQDMNNIHVGPSVKVNRMPDPERGQGVLAFS